MKGIKIMTTQEIKPFEDFKTKLSERIKDDIGSLIPDEVIQGMISDVIKKEFFDERVVKGSFSSKTEPSWFVKEIGQLAKPVLESAVKDWVSSNEQVLKDALSEFLNKESLLLVSMASMQNIIRQDTHEAIAETMLRIQRGY